MLLDFFNLTTSKNALERGFIITQFLNDCLFPSAPAVFTILTPHTILGMSMERNCYDDRHSISILLIAFSYIISKKHGYFSKEKLTQKSPLFDPQKS